MSIPPKIGYVSSTTFIVQPNVYDYLIVSSTTNTTTLPPVLINTQPIDIIYIGSGSAIILDSLGNTVTTLMPNTSVQLISSNASLTYTITSYNTLSPTQVNGGWLATGNNVVGALLGTTNNSPWSLIENNAQIATINSNNITMNNLATITGVPTPTNNSDVANKAYVDTGSLFLWRTIGNSITAGSLNLGTNNSNFWNIIQGGSVIATVTPGGFSMGFNTSISGLRLPVISSEAATKGYVDSQIGTLDWHVAGNSGTGGTGSLGTTDNASFNLISNNVVIASISSTGLTMNNGTVTGVPTPISSSDAVPKTYVDTNLSLYLKRDGTNSMFGNLNVPSSFILVGNQTTVPPVLQSAFTIQQSAELSTTGSTSNAGIKMYDSAVSGNAYYFGVDTSGNFTIFFQNTIANTFQATFTASTAGSTIYSPLSMNNNKIMNLATPTLGTDAANLTFVNQKKCPTPIVPYLNSDTSYSGYIVTASSEYSSSFRGYNCVNAAAEWAVVSGTTNYWVQVQLPQAVTVYMLALKGRIFDGSPSTWSLQGSNDGSSYINILNSTTPIPQNGPTLFFNLTSSTAYLYYRLFAFTSTAGSISPGLTCFQLYGYVI